MLAGSTIWHSQNFIRSVSVVREIVRLASLTRDDLVVEIGPGKGIITRQLVRVCSHVIAVERDRSLYNHLRATLGGIENLELICADFRRHDLPDREYKVIANIPFEITSDIIANITAGGRLPSEAYLVTQAEAARRYAGRPYDRESLKSLLIKTRFELAILHAFRSTDFCPCPSVDAVLLRISRRHLHLLTAAENRKYRDFMCFAFSEHGSDVATRLGRVFTRPQISRLARDNGFLPSARVVDLSFAQWLAIFRYYLAGGARDRQRLVDGAEKRLSRQQNGLTKIHRSRTVPKWRRSSDSGRRKR